MRPSSLPSLVSRFSPASPDLLSIAAAMVASSRALTTSSALAIMTASSPMLFTLVNGMTLAA